MPAFLGWGLLKQRIGRIGGEIQLVVGFSTAPVKRMLPSAVL